MGFRFGHGLRISLCATVLAVLAGVSSACTQGLVKTGGTVDMTGNTARPGWVAIKEEFDAAMKADTVSALELFIARHPDSPWTEEARARLAVLKPG